MMSAVNRKPLFFLGCVLVAIVTAGLTVGVARLAGHVGGASASAGCPARIPVGSGLGAAQRTVELFTTEVVLRHNPACGYALSSARLRQQISRRRWASGETPVRPLATRYPPVAYADASRNPDAHQAVYVISRQLLEFVRLGQDGEAQIPMMVGVAAPDAGLGSYRVILVLDEGNWRIDRWWRVHMRSRDF